MSSSRNFPATDFEDSGGAAGTELERLRAELRATREELARTRREHEVESSLLNFFLENVPDRVYFKDLDSRFIRCSASTARQHHLASADQMIGKTDFDFFPPDVAASFMAEEQEIISSEVPLLGKLHQTTTADGIRLWNSTSKLPLRARDGRVIGTFGLSKDVTGFKNMQEELLAAKNFYFTLVESLPMMLVRKNPKGRFTYSNQAFCSSIGRSSEEILGKTDFEFFPKDLALKFRLDDRAVMATGQRREYEEEYVNAAGERARNYVIKMPLFASDGTCFGIQAVFWDVTERYRAEERLKTAQKELVETSRLAGMAEVASGVLHNVGNVLNSVNVSATLVGDRVSQSKAANLSKVATLLASHRSDLGTFITSDPKGRMLPGYIADLARVLGEERQATLTEVELLKRNIEHIKDIVSMQQTYARVSGMLEPHAPIELVEDALRMNVSSLTRHDITLTRDFHAVPPVHVEKHKVLQILVNLIRNAKHSMDEAAPPQKHLVVRIVPIQESRRVQIAVIDNGLGISAENLTRIFSFGFTTKKDGHGFGLHTSALAAMEMDGTLTVQSDGPGRGATFTLELPAIGPRA